MAVKLPAFPAEASLAGLKKVKVKEPKFTPEGEWKHSFNGSKTLAKSVDELSAAYNKIDAKAFTDLEAAVKSGEDVIAKYQAMDAVSSHIESYAKLAASFKKAADKKAKLFTGDAKFDKLGKWYADAGTKVSENAEAIDKLSDDLLEKAEGVRLDKITDLKWDLNDWDLHHLLTKVHRFNYRHVDLDGKFLIKVSVTGKVGAQAADNATLRHEFFEAAYEVGKTKARALGEAIKKADDDFQAGKLDQAKAQKAIDAAYATFETEYEAGADAAIQKVWATFIKDKSDYKKYKIRTGFKIVGKTASLGVGVAATAAAGWTGVGTVMGAASSLKGAVELGLAIKDAWQEAKTIKEAIDAELLTLQERFKNAGAASAKETGGQALEALTGVRTTTVKSVTDKVKLFGSKIQGCHTNAVKMGKKIDAALKETKGLDTKLTKAKKELKDSSKAVKSLTKLEKQLDKFEKGLDKMLDAASDAASDYRQGKDAIKDYAAMLNQMDGEISKVAKAVNKWGMPFLKFAYVSDAPGAISTSGSVIRDLIAEGTNTTDELAEYNQAGDIAGDVTNLITGLMGK